MNAKQEEKKERTAQEIEGKNQEICRKLIDREVLHCCSNLVYELGKTELYQDEILNLCTGQDWESAAYDNGWKRAPEEMDTNFYREGGADEKPQGSDAATWQELCEEQNIDPYDVEVFEHWAVTDWFADQLKAHGEIVGELFDFTIWGRCTTGQAIYMDGIIREIGSEMEILAGQQNEWTE